MHAGVPRWVKERELEAREGQKLHIFKMSGAGEGNRTPDLRFTKPLLYRLSYAGPNTEMLTRQS